MSATYKIKYTNQCTPQEYVEFSDGSGRWYLDSNALRMSGTVSVDVNSSRSYTSATAISNGATTGALTSSDTFIYIEVTGENPIHITLDNSKYYITLAKGEVFCSNITTSAVVKAKALSGDTSIRTLKGNA